MEEEEAGSDQEMGAEQAESSASEREEEGEEDGDDEEEEGDEEEVEGNESEYSDEGSDVSGRTNPLLECAVCLQTCIQPVLLPCRHVFCYLCVKGIMQQSKKCAMCRREISQSFLENPQLVDPLLSQVVHDSHYQWFYEGRNGWWQYDDRSSTEIETAFKKGDATCEILIAGFLYIIDFQKNLQTRRGEPFRKRHIKRDLVGIDKKGISGIRDTPNDPLNFVAGPCCLSEDEEHNDITTEATT